MSYYYYSYEAIFVPLHFRVVFSTVLCVFMDLSDGLFYPLDIMKGHL